MYTVKTTSRFKKDIKSIQARGYNIEELMNVVKILAKGENLDSRYRDHSLNGKYAKYRECHIQPDWLLIYKVNKDELILFLSRTGTHSDVF